MITYDWESMRKLGASNIQSIGSNRLYGTLGVRYVALDAVVATDDDSKPPVIFAEAWSPLDPGNVLPQWLKDWIKEHPESIMPIPGAMVTRGGAIIGREALKLARKLGLRATTPGGQRVLQNLEMKVVDYIGKFRKASIREEFPTEFLNKTVREALTKGNSTVRKLLIHKDYEK